MKMRSNIKAIIGLGIFVLTVSILFAGCQSGTTKTNDTDGKMTNSHSDSGMHDMPSAPPQANVDATTKNEVEITIENFAFSPADITIAVGTKVTWINKDEAPHTATSTSPEKKFNSGGMDTDDKFSFTFNEKGDFPYFCALHPQMKADIKVK